MIRDHYRIRIAGMPPDGSKVSVLEIMEPWQDEALDEFAQSVLTDSQWQALDNGVIKTLTDDLHREAEHHLAQEAP